MRDPIKRKRNDLLYRTRHRERRNSYFQQYNNENRDAISARKLTNYDRLFGWPLGSTEWVVAVSSLCALCDEPFQEGQFMGPAVDHDHKTNTFRGVIHNRCNVGIGHLRDSEHVCLKAAAYLRGLTPETQHA
jgi:hypothetical protein